MWIVFRSVDGFAKQSLTQNLGYPPLENSVRMGSQSLVCCVWRYGDPAKREPEQLLIEWPRGKDRPENHFLSKARVPPPCQYIAAYWDFSSDSCTKKTLRHPLFGEIPALSEDFWPHRTPAAPAPYAGFNHDAETRMRLGDVRATESRRMSFCNTVKPIPTHNEDVTCLPDNLLSSRAPCLCISGNFSSRGEG